MNPAGIYLFKVNNRNSRKSCEICSKLTIKRRRSVVFIIKYEHVSYVFLLFLLLTLSWECTQTPALLKSLSILLLGFYERKKRTGGNLRKRVSRKLLLIPVFPFDPSENMRKSLYFVFVFVMFSGESKGSIGKTRVNTEHLLQTFSIISCYFLPWYTSSKNHVSHLDILRIIFKLCR